MKNLYKILLTGFLCSVFSAHVVAVPYFLIQTGDNQISIINSETGDAHEFLVGPDIITGEVVSVESMTLDITYEGQDVFVTNANTQVKEASLVFIEGEYIRPINANFFILRLFKRGNGSGTVITPKRGCILGIFCPRRQQVFSKRDSLCPEDNVQEGFYCGRRCTDTFCEEEYQYEKQKDITVTATPAPGSVLTNLNCDDKQIEEKESDGKIVEAIVLNCTATFDILPSLASTAISNNGEPLEISTSFAGGIYIKENLTENMTETESLPTVNINGIIKVDPEHVGQQSDMIVVASYLSGDESKKFYMRDGHTQYPFWDGNLAHLSAFQKNVRLAEERWIEIYSGPFPEGLWDFYFGYRLNNGTIVFNSEPIKK
jgi:hypothetical protein